MEHERATASRLVKGVNRQIEETAGMGLAGTGLQGYPWDARRVMEFRPSRLELSNER